MKRTLTDIVIGVGLMAAVAFAATGCAMSPRSARTEVKPGESRVFTEREERRPVEHTTRLKVQTPGQAPARPVVRIKVDPATNTPEASR